MNIVEEWCPILGYEGRYEVSSLGRVRSLDRAVVDTRGVIQNKRSKVLRPGRRQGYLVVALYKEGGRPRTIAVHVLVAEAWHGQRPEGMDVCHANDVKTDNRPENLRFGTRSENLRDRVRNGLDPNASKTHCAHGHEFTPANTYAYTRKGTPRRTCRTCSRARTRRYRAEAAA